MERDRRPLADLPVPPTISALLAARLDRLPRIERRLIEIASVMGQVFYLGAVRELSSDGSDAVDVGSLRSSASSSCAPSAPTCRRPTRSGSDTC